MHRCSKKRFVPSAMSWSGGPRSKGRCRERTGRTQLDASSLAGGPRKTVRGGASTTEAPLQLPSSAKTHARNSRGRGEKVSLLPPYQKKRTEKEGAPSILNLSIYIQKKKGSPGKARHKVDCFRRKGNGKGNVTVNFLVRRDGCRGLREEPAGGIGG